MVQANQSQIHARGRFFPIQMCGHLSWLHKVKHLFKWGAQYKVKNGRSVSFWEDSWLNDIPLILQYPSLYTFCRDKEATVHDCFDGENWNINFNRSLSEIDMNLWNSLMLDLQSIRVDDSEGEDEVIWALTKDKRFTTRSLYIFITHGGVISTVDECIWKCRLPMKIKVFLWQLRHNKLQAAAVLKRRGWKGGQHCSLCGAIETIDHICYACPCIRDAFI